LFDRLARLTQLEVLNIGYRTYGMNPGMLKMTLENGLHKLAGLRKMKELDMTDVSTMIGIKEVQWTADNWPRLRGIHGFERDYHEEVVGWLSENHPKIAVSYKSSW